MYIKENVRKNMKCIMSEIILLLLIQLIQLETL
jgi:hypothetical protein